MEFTKNGEIILWYKYRSQTKHWFSPKITNNQTKKQINGQKNGEIIHWVELSTDHKPNNDFHLKRTNNQTEK